MTATERERDRTARWQGAARVTELRGRRSPEASHLVLGLLCAASATLLVVLGTRLTFFNDDWFFLLQRPGLESHGGLDTLLAAHNGNMEVLAAAIYKGLVAVFGLGSQVPYRLVIALAIVCLGALVYAIVAARVGPAIGVAAAAIVLFLGPASEALLSFGSSNHLLAVVFGLGALVALESKTPTRDALACALLVLAVSVSNTGLAFVAGAVIAVLLRRRPADLWVPAVPAAMFGLWWAFYGHNQPTGVTAAHIEHLPRYIFDALSVGLAAITGLEHSSLPMIIFTGQVLTAIALPLLIVWFAWGHRPTKWSLVIAGTLLVFWLLTGASAIPGREPAAGRYQVVDATLLIVLIAELLRGTKVSRGAVGAIALVAVAIVVSNLFVMRNGYDLQRTESQYAQADLGALEIAGPRVPPSLRLVEPVARNPHLSGVTAGRYFAVTRAHGTPPFYSAAQLLSAPTVARQAADSVLVAAYGPIGQPAGSTGSPTGCSRLPADGSELPFRAPGVRLRNLSAAPLVVGVSRFAPRGMPILVDFLAGRGVGGLRIPADSAAVPWRITFRNPRGAADAAVDVCQLGG